MGINEWIFNKATKKIEENFTQEDPDLIQNDEIEKQSYSEHSYKKVKKLREKGKYWAIDVPYLQHPVQKQEKPRPLFMVFGVLYLLVLIASLALSVIIVTYFLLPLIAQAIGLNSLVKVRAWDIFGLVAMFSSIVPIFIWTIIIAVAALIIGINAFLIYETINMFHMSKISMQEMAKGYEVGSMLFALGTIMVVTLITGITILVLTRENIKPAGIALVVGVMLIVCAIVGTIFGLLMAQRVKANKQFETLPEEQQNDFIRHNRALDRIHRHRNRKNKSIISSTEVDF